MVAQAWHRRVVLEDSGSSLLCGLHGRAVEVAAQTQ